MTTVIIKAILNTLDVITHLSDGGRKTSIAVEYESILTEKLRMNAFRCQSGEEHPSG
jgi:hypothetical protein